MSKASVARHAVHVDVEATDAKAEAAKAAALFDQFLAGDLGTAEDVLARGGELIRAQVRIAKSLVADNPRAASTIAARAQGALLELHARAFKVVGTDAQPPAIVDNSVRILAVLDRMDPEALRALTGQEKPIALVGEVTRVGS